MSSKSRSADQHISFSGSQSTLAAAGPGTSHASMVDCNDKKICVVVPCYNEEAQLGKVLSAMPSFISHVCVVDDCSTDDTFEIAKEFQLSDPRIHLIRHAANQGVGGAIASGYKWARDLNVDAAVVMAGDAQMNPRICPRCSDRC